MDLDLEAMLREHKPEISQLNTEEVGRPWINTRRRNRPVLEILLHLDMLQCGPRPCHLPLLLRDSRQGARGT